MPKKQFIKTNKILNKTKSQNNERESPKKQSSTGGIAIFQNVQLIHIFLFNDGAFTMQMSYLTFPLF